MEPKGICREEGVLHIKKRVKPPSSAGFVLKSWQYVIPHGKSNVSLELCYFEQ